MSQRLRAVAAPPARPGTGSRARPISRQEAGCRGSGRSGGRSGDAGGAAQPGRLPAPSGGGAPDSHGLWAATTAHQVQQAIVSVGLDGLAQQGGGKGQSTLDDPSVRSPDRDVGPAGSTGETSSTGRQGMRSLKSTLADDQRMIWKMGLMAVGAIKWPRQRLSGRAGDRGSDPPPALLQIVDKAGLLLS